MKLIFLGLSLALGLASSKPSGITPTFTLLEQKSDIERPEFESQNHMPLPPILHVAFPNGYTDRMILRHFYTENENAAGCYYFGQLEKEVDACVAMTGCIGSEDVSFTIMSEHSPASGMYKWNRDGSVQNLENLSKNHADTVIFERTDNTTAEWRNEDIRKLKAISRNSSPPQNQKLEIKVAYDSALRNSVGSVEKLKLMFQAVRVHLQAKFCLTSLGSRIWIHQVGDLIHFNRFHTIVLPHHFDDMRVLDFTAENLGDADLMVYLTQGDYGGLAWVGSVCEPNSWYNNGAKQFKYSISDAKQDPALFGGLIAHEIGHNLGMKHDWDHVPSCKSSENIMTGFYPATKWSVCSKSDFRKHYNNLKSVWCLQTLNSDACCQNTYTNCDDLASKNYCNTHKTWMTVFCRKSCLC